MLPHFEQWLTEQFETTDDNTAPPLTLSTIMTSNTHIPFKVREQFMKRRYVSHDETNRYLCTWGAADDFIHSIWELYNKRNLIDNTLFVFIGDHGLGMHDTYHNLWGTIGQLILYTRWCCIY